MRWPIHWTDWSHPEHQGLAVLTFGIVFLCFRRYRTGAGLGMLGLLWILICATPAFAALLRHGLVDPYPPRQAFEYPVADAIVVLGGGDPPDFGHGQGREQSNRTGFAFQLYRAQRAPLIVASGGAGEAAEILNEHLHRILLVTSTVPMRRAAACFERQGFEVIPAPSLDGNEEPVGPPAWRPQSEELFRSSRYLHEYLGMLFYKLRGWI
jgi:uncharacterized SAM-binding protein YcdF (DUF218 family)